MREFVKMPSVYIYLLFEPAASVPRRVWRESQKKLVDALYVESGR